ncbi:MAG: glycosyltransferase [Bauldia sp.]|nr:glycosyltransferase [Bauldia sp.]
MTSTAPRRPASTGLPQAEFVTANRLAAEGQLEEAEAAYRRLLDVAPGSAPLLCKLGDLVRRKSQPREALSWYEQAIAADPAFPWAHVGQADALVDLHEPQKAVSALERAQAADPSLTFISGRIQELRDAKARERQPHPLEIGTYWPADAPPPLSEPDSAARKRIAFIAWDLGHNAMGRALTLAEMAARVADCEVLGPLFRRYGGDLWPPLRDGPRLVPIRGFRAEGMADLLDQAIAVVEANPCDIAWVSKARFPGLLIGFLYKAIHRASVIIDLDDDELAMVGADEGLSFDEFVRDGAPEWDQPFGRRWTQLAQSMIPWADVITVCNPVLRERHGGILIRHARWEDAFDKAAPRRNELRAEFGLSGSDKVVLFLGTAHRHKGIVQVVEALEEIGDPDAVFCIAGSIPDASLASFLESQEAVRVKRLGEQPFARLAEINAIADVVCLLQESDNRIAQSQTPAKITDALASGTRVIATPTPPLMDLAGEGGVTTIGDAGLVASLRAALDPDRTDAGSAEARRAFFRAELSFAANLPRVEEAIAAARQRRSHLAPDFLRILHYIELTVPGGLSRRALEFLNQVLPQRTAVGPLVSTERGLNIVFFWKQNDSGLYGRRQDMLLREMASSPRVNRILHVEAPISIDALAVDAAGNGVSRPAQARLVSANVLARFLETEDEDRLHRRSFIFGPPGRTLLGRTLPQRADFADTVRGWLAKLGMTENVLAWVCPVVPQFAEIHDRVGFSFTVADVIDDQRAWPMTDAHREMVESGYRDTFALADMAFANCEPVAGWVRDVVRDVFVVPNGIEPPPGDVDSWEVPPALRRLNRPIIGYAGNMSHRIDWALLADVADARPDWTIVLIGAVPGDSEDCARVIRRRNVHALGPIPYEKARAFIAAFDVAIVPHAVDAISERMNPLKIYVYRSLGLPVVSTPVPNADDLADEVGFAASSASFVAEIDRRLAVRRERGRIYPARRDDLTWRSRMETIFQAIDTVSASRGTRR